MSDFGCVGTKMRVVSGRYLDLAAPDPVDITMEDIAAGLSKICRFGGQVRRFYSVAEHSVNCACVARYLHYAPSIQLACLLHDAAEAYVGDVIRPLKQLITRDYHPIETRIRDAIASRFGLRFDDRSWERIDDAVLLAEWRILFPDDAPPRSLEWAILPPDGQIGKLYFWTPEIAEEEFLWWAYRLLSEQRLP